MKIAMIGHKRIPSREGGIEIVVEELGVRMARVGHNVTCYNRSGHHVSGKKYNGQKIKNYKGIKLKTVFTLDIKGAAAMSASLFAALRAAFGQYDVVHFHAEGPCAMLWLPKLFGKRCIATIHGLDHQRAKWGRFAKIYIMAGEKTAVKYADEIIVLSRNIQDYFNQTYKRKTIFIPNGVTPPQIKEPKIIQQEFGLSKNGYILFLGRIVPEKGLAHLIKAFKMVQTDKKLVIAGGTSDTDFYMNKLQIMAKEDDRIIFTGFIQGRILQELYSNAYVYTLPSDLEGMPLSLLEAMSYGNCCLVSDIDECTEVVGNKALTFTKGSIEELRNKLQMCCDNNELVNKYKDGASNYICQHYNWDDIAKKTLNLYKSNYS